MTYIKNPRGHVVFDCDGTIISSFDAVLEAVAEVMTIMLDRNVIVQEAREKYVADLAQISANFGLDPVKDDALKMKLMKTWEEVAAKQTLPFRLFPGLKDLVLKLRSMDYQTYVWTARDRRSTLRILKELEIAEHFLEKVISDAGKGSKEPNGSGQR